MTLLPKKKMSPWKMGCAIILIIYLIGAIIVALNKIPLFKKEIPGQLILAKISPNSDALIYAVENGSVTSEPVWTTPPDFYFPSATSPDGRYVIGRSTLFDVVTKTYYPLDLTESCFLNDTLGEFHSPCASFSPDSRYLGYVEWINGNRGNVVLLDMEKLSNQGSVMLDTSILYSPEGSNYYNCGFMRRTAAGPIWIGSETVMVPHANETVELPSSTVCGGSIGQLDQTTIFDTTGKTLQKLDAYPSGIAQFTEIPGIGQSFNTTTLLSLMNEQGSIQLVWWDLNDVLQGKLDPHPITMAGPSNYFLLSPDGKTIFVVGYPYKLIDIQSGSTTEVKFPNSSGGPGSCIWLNNTELMACLTDGVAQSPGENGTQKLLLINTESGKITTVKTLDYQSDEQEWKMITWLP